MKIPDDISPDEARSTSSFFTFVFIFVTPFCIEVHPFYDFRIFTDSIQRRNKRIQHTSCGTCANFLYIMSQFLVAFYDSMQLNLVRSTPKKGHLNDQDNTAVQDRSRRQVSFHFRQARHDFQQGLIPLPLPCLHGGGLP
jgi:hypothetical protein